MKNSKNSKIKLTVCAMLAAGLLFASCTDGSTEETTAPETTAVEAQTTETTEESTEEVTEPVTEEETTEAVTEETTEAETLPEEPTVVVNPLTGIESDVDYMSRRPVAIMINNVRTNVGGTWVITGQRGISLNDLMYECVVEGGLTRLMMVVSDWENLPEVGSIRSSREYFLDFAANHNAIYVHAGGSEQAYIEMRDRKVNRLDFVNPVNGVSMYAYNYRAQDLLNKGYDLEHTLMSTGELITKAIGRMGYSTALRSGFDSPLDFVKLGDVKVPTGGDATYLQVRYSSGHTPYYKYNAGDGLYYRYQYGGAHIDQANNKQLAFDNIIMLYCSSYNTKDAKQHQDVTTTGTGTGYYFTKGKYEEIVWKKAYEDAPLKLYTKDDEPLLVNRGKTFFQICETSQSEYTVIK